MKRKKFNLEKFFDFKGKLLLCVIFYVTIAVFVFNAIIESWIISFIFTACTLPLFLKKINNWLREKRQVAIEKEFYILLSQLSMAMSSGMSLENAFKEAVITGEKEYKTIKTDLKSVYRLLQNNYPPEYVFAVLAKKTDNQEIKTFAEIISVGIPAGINIAGLMRWLTSAYRMRTDTEGEISRILNAPKYNNRIILIMPVLCILLFKQIAPSYVEPLYTGYGRGIIIFVVFIIVLAWWLGEKISKIDY